MLKRRNSGNMSVRKIDVCAEIKWTNIAHHLGGTDQDILAVGFNLLEKCDGIENIVAAAFLDDTQKAKVYSILQHITPTSNLEGTVTFTCTNEMTISQMTFQCHDIEHEPVEFEYGLAFGHMPARELSHMAAVILDTAQTIYKRRPVHE